MSKGFIFYLLIFLLGFYSCKKDDFSPSDNAYFLDIQNGSDLTGDGSESNPFKTFERAMDTLQAGDQLFLKNGNYGKIVVGRTPGNNWGSPNEITVPYSKFNTWVTISAAPGHNPHIGSLEIGTLNIPNSGSPSKAIPFSQKGNSDLYMKFEGLIIEDGVNIRGSRYVTISNCKISRLGDLNGSVSNIDNKTGIGIINGQYITIENNEITHVAVGIGAASYNLVIKENKIHHNSHDGIRVLGGENILIEGNSIHDLDDGVDDGQADWNRHSDGIHLFQLLGVTKHLQVKRNLFYNIEAIGIMLQGGDETNHNADWLFENNIFGPVGGLLIHFGADVYDGFVFRHNTVVYAPNNVWTSIYGRVMTGQIYRMSMWTKAGVTEKYYYYNNIILTGTMVPDAYGFSEGNLYFKPDQLPYEAIPGNFVDYINSGKIPGSLLDNSSAINAGTTKYAGECKFDFNGKTRDSKPDIGAIEK